MKLYRKDDYICGTGTVFNQEILSCDYPDNVDCAASSSFYSANSEFGKNLKHSHVLWLLTLFVGKGSPEPGGDTGAAKPGQRPAVQRPTPQQAQEPDYGGAEEPQYAAPRPAAPPAQRPRAPPAARPPPEYRPASSGQRPAVAPRPRPKTAPRPQAPRPAAPAPARTPSKARPRPQVNQQQLDQPLDYEPSEVVQRRVVRQNAQSSAFQKRSGALSNRRWQMMPQEY